MPQVVIGDLRTGRRLLDLPFSSLAWTRARNTAETIRCGIPLSSRLVRKLGLRNATTPGKTFIAVIENDNVMAAGPIWSRTYTKATQTLSLAGAGLWSYYDHRQILPLLADSVNVIDPTTGASLAAANTDFVNATYGLMAKRLIQQSMLWTGGDLPITFAADEVGGTRNKTYLGANLTKIGEGLRQLTQLVNGVDIDFLPQRTADRMGIQWLLRTGTVDAPEIHGSSVHVWDYSVPVPSIRNLITRDDAARMTAQAWTTGGRQDGSSVIERVRNTALLDAGYPLLESVDSSHADVALSSTLLQYSALAVRLGRAPEEQWTFEVDSTKSPRVGSFWPGDYGDIKIANDPWIPDSPFAHRREIASISGDQDGKWNKVTAEEVLSA